MYGSVLVTKLVNSIMLDGKKGVAQKVVYGAFDIIKEKTDKEPLEVFNDLQRVGGRATRTGADQNVRMIHHVVFSFAWVCEFLFVAANGVFHHGISVYNMLGDDPGYLLGLKIADIFKGKINIVFSTITS